MNQHINNKTTLSVVLICRNEIKYIQNVINSFLNQSYVPDEFIIVDGMSDDGTYEYLLDIEKKYDTIRILRNEKKYAPHGLNLGIKNSRSDYIMIAGSHTVYNNDYLKITKEFLDEHSEIDCAGGIAKAQENESSVIQSAMAEAYSNPFGIGGAKHRFSTDVQEVDTVAYAVYRKSVFEKNGYFDERLIRNQDIEFNYRIRGTGSKIYMLPVENKYLAPSGLEKFLKKNYANGYWNYITFKISKKGLSLRHFIPLFFTIFLMLYFIVDILDIKLLSIPGSIVLALYFLLDIIFSYKGVKERKKYNIFPFLIIIFPMLHISYGLGTFMSVLRGGKID